MRFTATLILLMIFCGCEEKPEMATGVRKPNAQHTVLKILSWNIESDRNSPAVIAEQLKSFSNHSIIGLQEVKAENEPLYTEALGVNKKSLVSKLGKSDRLVIAYDTSRLELLSI